MPDNFDVPEDGFLFHMVGGCSCTHEDPDVFVAAALRDVCAMLYHGAPGWLWLPSTHWCWCNGPDGDVHDVPVPPTWAAMPTQSAEVWEFLDHMETTGWDEQDVYFTVMPFPSLPPSRREPATSLHLDVEVSNAVRRLEDHLTTKGWMAADAGGDSLSVAVPLSRPVRSHEATRLTGALAKHLQAVEPEASIRPHRVPRRWPSSLATMKAEGEVMEVLLATPVPRQPQDVDELAALLGVPLRAYEAPRAPRNKHGRGR